MLDVPGDVNISRACMHLLTRCMEADPEQRADITEVKSHPWLNGSLDAES